MNRWAALCVAFCSSALGYLLWPLASADATTDVPARGGGAGPAAAAAGPGGGPRPRIELPARSRDMELLGARQLAKKLSFIGEAEIVDLIERTVINNEDDLPGLASLFQRLAAINLDRALALASVHEFRNSLIGSISETVMERNFPQGLDILKKYAGDSFGESAVKSITRLAQKDAAWFIRHLEDIGIANLPPDAIKDVCGIAVSLGVDFADLPLTGGIPEKDLAKIAESALRGGLAPVELVIQKIIPRLGSYEGSEAVRGWAQAHAKDILDNIGSIADDKLRASLLKDIIQNPDLGQQDTFRRAFLLLEPASQPKFASEAGKALGLEEALGLLPTADADSRHEAAWGAFAWKATLMGPDAAFSEADGLTDAECRQGALEAVCATWADIEPNTTANKIIENGVNGSSASLLADVLPKWEKLDESGLRVWLDHALTHGRIDPAMLSAAFSVAEKQPGRHLRLWLHEHTGRLP